MIDPKEVIRIPKDINQGLSSAKNSTMLQILGMPRDTIDSKCRPVTNQPMKSLLTTRDVGPFRAHGLKNAVASLKKVLAKVKKAYPEVYSSLGYSGMLCVRKIKGSDRLSNHSWGSAIDINIEGALDGISVGGGTGKLDGRTLAGLAAMAPFFNEEGWYWGAGFSNFEDGMHFEIADETIRDWHKSGKLGARASRRETTPSNLSIGDRGIEVKRLQEALADLGYDILADGNFGPITRGIVIDFQASNDLLPDGIVGPKTMKVLKL